MIYAENVKSLVEEFVTATHFIENNITYGVK